MKNIWRVPSSAKVKHPLVKEPEPIRAPWGGPRSCSQPTRTTGTRSSTSGSSPHLASLSLNGDVSWGGQIVLGRFVRRYLRGRFVGGLFFRECFLWRRFARERFVSGRFVGDVSRGNVSKGDVLWGEFSWGSVLFGHVESGDVLLCEGTFCPVTFTVRKEMNCSGETYILHQLGHDTRRINSWLSDFRVVSWTNLWRISVSPSIHLISFITVFIDLNSMY